MDNIIAFVVCTLAFLVGMVVGAIERDNSVNKKLLESCEKHGIYIIEGAAIQCPAVIKTKE